MYVKGLSHDYENDSLIQGIYSASEYRDLLRNGCGLPRNMHYTLT